MVTEPIKQIEQGTDLPRLKIELLAALFVVCVTVLVVHWPALSAKALSFDDDQYLTENVLVRNPGWKSAQRFLTEVLQPSTVAGYYQPLSMISLMTDYAVGGRSDNLRPFHRTSLALHVANTALVIVLLYLLFGRIWAAAAVGLLFGLHPMTVEPIPWIGERKTLLAAFFAFWCLILYIHYARKGDWKFLAGCLLMYILALMSKPTSLPLPVLMLLMDYWPLRRLNRRVILEKLPFFIIGALFAVITYISQNRAAAAELAGGYDLKCVPLVICYDIIFYLYKIIWPAHLSSHYPFPQPLALSDPMVLAGAIGTCILIPLLIISLRWTRAALTGWLFFFLAILPTIQVFRFSNVIASDKFAYLPSLGLLMVLTSFLIWLIDASKLTLKRVLIAAIVLVLAGAESVATRRYLVHWRDTQSFCEYMLTLTPDVSSLHEMLGQALSSQGELNEAIWHYRKALTLPNDGAAYNSLGVAFASQGKLDEAVDYFRQALQVDPKFAQAHNNLGMALSQLGRFDEAIWHYLQALHFKPDFVQACNNLGVTLVEQGKLDEAIACYRRAIDIYPGFVQAYNNFGMALYQQGKLDEALKYFRQAVDLKFDYVKPLYCMARILATHPDPNMRDISRAIVFAERAARLTNYRDAPALEVLAAVYAAEGQFDKAVTTAQTASDLASAAGDNKLADSIRRQIELYKKQKP